MKETVVAEYTIIKDWINNIWVNYRVDPQDLQRLQREAMYSN
jgi:hypothetical protein